MITGIRLREFLQAKLTLAIVTRRTNVDIEYVKMLGFTERKYYNMFEESVDLSPHSAYTYLNSILTYVVKNIEKDIDSVMAATLLETKHSRVRNLIDQILSDDRDTHGDTGLAKEFTSVTTTVDGVDIQHYRLSPYGFRLLMAHLVGLRGGKFNEQRLLWRVEVFKALDVAHNMPKTPTPIIGCDAIEPKTLLIDISIRCIWERLRKLFNV
jgi:hypothetical protein